MNLSQQLISWRTDLGISISRGSGRLAVTSGLGDTRVLLSEAQATIINSPQTSGLIFGQTAYRQKRVFESLAEGTSVHSCLPEYEFGTSGRSTTK